MFFLSVDRAAFNRSPFWKRSVVVDKNGGIFVAAAVGGKEKEVSFLALKNSSPSLILFDHVFVSVSWMTESYPQSRESCNVLVTHAKNKIQRLVVSAFGRSKLEFDQRAIAFPASSPYRQISSMKEVRRREEVCQVFDALSSYLDVSEMLFDKSKVRLIDVSI